MARSWSRYFWGSWGLDMAVTRERGFYYYEGRGGGVMFDGGKVIEMNLLRELNGKDVKEEKQQQESKT